MVWPPFFPSESSYPHDPGGRVPITQKVEPTRAGVLTPEPQEVVAAGAYIEQNDGHIVLEVWSSTTTVWEFVIPDRVDGQEVPPKTVTTGGVKKVVGPFPPEIYNQADNSVHVDVDNAYGVLRAYRI